jgi:hypothetical protein
MDPEDFFWTESAPRIARNRNAFFKTRENLRLIFMARLFSNPLPYIGNRIIRARNLFYRRYWHLHPAVPAWPSELTDEHRARAARYDLVHEPGLRRTFARALATRLWRLSGLSFLLLPLLIGLIPVLFARKLWFTLMITSAVLGGSGVAVLLSPTANWAYAVYVPLWSMCAIWFAGAEWTAKRWATRLDRLKLHA